MCQCLQIMRLVLLSKTFQFNGKLPTDASNLAYVLNQDPGNISESEIAPFLSYMYSATQTQRDEFGNDTVSHAQSRKR
jgi:hypothetical protein